MSWEGRHSSDRPRLVSVASDHCWVFKIIQNSVTSLTFEQGHLLDRGTSTNDKNSAGPEDVLISVLLGAAQIITPIFSAWKLEPIASTLFSRFSKKDLNKESEKNLSWLFFFVIISLFVCWSTLKAGYRDPQVRFLDIPKCLFMAAVKGGWEGRGCGDIAMQCTG